MDTGGLRPSSDWRIGQHVTLTNCYGTAAETGTIVGFPGPYSVTVRTGRSDVSASTSLIVVSPQHQET